MKGDKERARCPVCTHPGVGPYTRYVLNDRKQRFEPYYYFHHEPSDSAGKEWCYIPKKQARRLYQELSNQGEASQLKIREKLSSPAPRPIGKRSRRGKGCRGCRYLTVLDSQPFCSLLQSFVTPETLGQPYLGFEEEKHR